MLMFILFLFIENRENTEKHLTLIFSENGYSSK